MVNKEEKINKCLILIQIRIREGKNLNSVKEIYGIKIFNESYIRAMNIFNNEMVVENGR